MYVYIRITFGFSLLVWLQTYGQQISQAQHFALGEKLHFRIHYGFIDGGYAVAEIKESKKYPDAIYAKLRAWNTGLFKMIFDARYVYSSHIDARTLLPKSFHRIVREGDFRLNRKITFDHQECIAEVTESGESKTYNITPDIQDIVSSMIALRARSSDSSKVGDRMTIKLFIDREMFNFELELLAFETIDTDFGKVPCLKLRPYVQSGGLFKSGTEIAIWISDDPNHILIRAEAEVIIGSVSIDLTKYSGLKYPLKVKS